MLAELRAVAAPEERRVLEAPPAERKAPASVSHPSPARARPACWDAAGTRVAAASLARLVPQLQVALPALAEAAAEAQPDAAQRAPEPEQRASGSPESARCRSSSALASARLA
jgi:hypothetical protein